MGILNVFKKPAGSAEAPKKPVVHADPKAKTMPVGEKVPAVPAAPRVSARTILPNTLVRRMVTEKASGQAAQHQYTFVVSPVANKITVAEAIRQRYNVNPISVRMINRPGRTMRFGRRQGTTKAWKKAIVTLPEGSKIEGGKSA